MMMGLVRLRRPRRGWGGLLFDVDALSWKVDLLLIECGYECVYGKSQAVHDKDFVNMAVKV